MPSKTGFENNVSVVIQCFGISEKMAYIQGTVHLGINVEYFFSKTKSLELFCSAKTFLFVRERVLQ